MKVESEGEEEDETWEEEEEEKSVKRSREARGPFITLCQSTKGRRHKETHQTRVWAPD
jgi:hypothetical protein